MCSPYLEVFLKVAKFFSIMTKLCYTHLEINHNQGRRIAAAAAGYGSGVRQIIDDDPQANKQHSKLQLVEHRKIRLFQNAAKTANQTLRAFG
jgi:hypothetical protein